MGDLPMPVGIEDFKELRESYYSIDKTKFIKKLLDSRSKVTLITRPRRFGKTLMMSMLYYFFTNDNAKENRRLFAGTMIEETGEKYMAEQGKRPVVLVSLKDANGNNWDNVHKMIKQLLSLVYDGFLYLLESKALSENDKNYFQRIYERHGDEDETAVALMRLCHMLEKHFGHKVLLLIDEYDTPVQAAWEHGYYDEAIGFMRIFLGSALKTNRALDFAVLTGVLRISKESIFSTLNNLYVSSVIKGDYADIFGFTQAEVKKMAADLGKSDKVPEIKTWYDGYNFSGQEIYNPWSVINYFRDDCTPAAYWVNTSVNAIMADMLEQGYDGLAEELSLLLAMKTIDTRINEAVTYADITQGKAALYTILLTAGYLKKMPTELSAMPGYVSVAIPNQEIRTVYAWEIVAKIDRLGKPNAVRFLNSLLKGDADGFAAELAKYLEASASYYDTANREEFYHGFMLGILAMIPPMQYEVRSNRESGYGRFDLAVSPKKANLAGVLMEFKVAKSENELEQEVQAALQQILDRDYLAEFRVHGINTVWQYGIAFCGKKLLVRRRP